MEQTNQYIKQFPELFKGKKVLYVHGFGSSGRSGTVNRIRTVLPNAEVIAPDLPIHPQEALDLLRDLCARQQPDLIIGTSMGGMYTEMLYGYDRIVINPAFGIADTMGEHGLTGKQQFFSPREDGIQEFYVDKPLVKEYRAICEGNFSQADNPEEQKRIIGLFGDEDPLVHTYDTFRSHYPTAIRFHGEHRMNDKSFMHSVLPVIRWVDDRQEGRERPIIYIDVDAMVEGGVLKVEGGGLKVEARSSCQKAIRQLIEDYQLYFVAPAENVDFGQITAWLYDHINVPAYAHTVFTCRKDLLYGDYLIDTEKTEGMATLIHFGSDTFKTWEDVITYFARLGGQ